MKIDYARMIETYTQINKLIQDIEENMKTVKTTVNSLDGSEEWQGKAYNNYKNNINKFYELVSNYCDSMKNVSQTIQKTVENYKTVDNAAMQAAHSGGGGSF